MGCGCNKGQWTPPTAEEVAASDAARTAAGLSTKVGGQRRSRGTTWNGPQPVAASAADSD